MSMLFSAMTPVLHVREAIRRKRDYLSDLYCLYPAFCYRVMAPDPSNASDDLSILERAVFGLCTTGETRAVDISRRLHVDASLIASVLSTLQQRGLLGRDGGPLPATKSREGAFDRSIVGHVFQDPWSARLWPKFASEVVYLDASLNAKGFPELSIGATGNPRFIVPFLIPGPAGVEPSVPDAGSILKVVRRSRRMVDAATSDDVDDEDMHGIEATSMSAIQRLTRLASIDSLPTPIYLLLRIYCPLIRFDGAPWEACDPFTGTRSAIARRAIEALLPTSKQLQERITSMTGYAVSKESPDLIAMMQDIEMQAGDQVSVRLHQRELSKDLRTALTVMQRSLLEAQAWDAKVPLDKLDDVLSKAQKSLELLIQEVRQARPCRLPSGAIPHDQDRCSTAVTDAARALGFTTPLPKRLIGVRSGKISHAYREGIGSLQPLFLCLLFEALHDAEHPLRRAAAERPGLPAEINELAKFRDEASHAGKSWARFPVSLTIVARMVSLVFDTLELLRSPAATAQVTTHKTQG